MIKQNIKDVISFLKPEFVHKDDRGSLRQLVSEGWKQINVNSSAAGSIRGGHHHKNNREAFFVISGKFNLKLKTLDGKITSFLMSKEDFFVIEKNVSHSFEFLEETWLVALYDKGVVEKSAADNNKIDMYQDVW